jgi:asparagine synthase (glutamine-hydrolysing)
MPGILGLITKMSRECAARQLREMLSVVRHEPSYSTGTWIDESLGAYVGWSERRNCFADGMPAANERGDVSLIFSGEDFPNPEVRGLLKRKGHSLGPAEASYLVHLYEENPQFESELNGSFHGIVADRTRQTIKLFNDRYGMHRLYYAQTEEAFYFASEAKAILKVRPELRSVDPRGLGELVTFGCVLENRTAFRGLHVLPGAASWTFRRHALEKKTTYFDPSQWENQEIADQESHFRKLCEILSQNLDRYFSGEEKVAMSLTGGLDTRLIMAWRKAPPQSLRCYTFGGMLRECRDVKVARHIARVCRQEHEVIPLGEDFLSRFDHYAERTVFLTDGCTSVRFAPDLYLNQQVARIAPVRMTGNYGDEVFRRSRSLKPAHPNQLIFQPELLSQAAVAMRTCSELTPNHPLSFALFQQAPWAQYGLSALEKTQVSTRSPFLDNTLVRQMYRAPESTCVSNELRLRLIREGDPALRRIPTDLGFGGRGAAGSVQQRLHHLTMKAEYAYDYGMPQWLAKINRPCEALHFERAFLGRHKFCHFRLWYRSTLASYVRDILLDSRALSRPYLDREGMKTAIHGHLNGVNNYTTQIHQLLHLELLHRLFID